MSGKKYSSFLSSSFLKQSIIEKQLLTSEEFNHT